MERNITVQPETVKVIHWILIIKLLIACLSSTYDILISKTTTIIVWNALVHMVRLLHVDQIRRFESGVGAYFIKFNFMDLIIILSNHDDITLHSGHSVGHI